MSEWLVLSTNRFFLRAVLLSQPVGHGRKVFACGEHLFACGRKISNISYDFSGDISSFDDGKYHVKPLYIIKQLSL